MSANDKSDPELEIGHVLVMDVVGYSKLLIHRQSEILQRLNEIVRGTNQFRTANTQGKLIRLPTGDGMALVFGDPKAPIECAMEVATALKSYPEIQLRMGIHSGPINEVLDVNERTNVAGAGIDIAQRVMDCGDAGHILLSKRVADDLAPYARWNAHLHELGECEVKHGRKISLVNFYTDEVGNPQSPLKLAPKSAEAVPSPAPSPTATNWRKLILLTGFLLLAMFGILLWRFSHTARVIPAETSIPEKSIAVLPFENRSEDKANAYFADGVQDEILTRLSKIGDLKVISRTSTRRYKSAPENLSEIGKQLGVANLLEGSVQKTKDQVRVNVQLIRAANDSHLWAETFDRRLTDIFAVESEVASAIADKLQAALTGSEQQALASKPTTNLDAYDAYLHGLDFDRRTESPADLLEAIRFLELAVKLDPTFALAWARLGRVEANFYFQDIDISPARRESARNAVETAVRLQPDLGESWLALGYYRFFCERNLKLARTAFENARHRLPNDSDVLLALSYVDLHQGRPDNALVLQAQALQLDPRNVVVFLSQAETFISLRRFAEARAVHDQALMITPHETELMAFKAGTYQAEGDLKRANELFGETAPEPWTARAYPMQLRQLMFERRYDEMISRLRPLLAERGPSTEINRDTYYWLLGMAQKLTGDLDGARSTFAQGRDFVLAIIQKSGGPQGGIHATIALMYAGVGDKPNALREANRAVELEGDDTYFGPSAGEVLAIVEVQTGETASALARLPKLLNDHYFSWLSFAPLTPALLRIDPVWDPLRNDPQFQKLSQEVKP
jgi:TolB-like protein/Tfp pilus assembly protein PilF